MAIGPDNQILIGCNAASPNGHRNTVVINQKSGAVLKVLKDLGGADEVWFNPGRRPLHHPVLQHSLPHSSSDVCHSLVPSYSGSSTQADSSLDQTVTIAEQNSVTTRYRG